MRTLKVKDRESMWGGGTTGDKVKAEECWELRKCCVWAEEWKAQHRREIHAKEA